MLNEKLALFQVALIKKYAEIQNKNLREKKFTKFV